MTRYQNISGTSGVWAYDINGDSIIVEFTDGAAYLYTSYSTSYNNIQQMKKYALAGSGLNTFISKTVKKGYASKLR